MRSEALGNYNLAPEAAGLNRVDEVEEKEGLTNLEDIEELWKQEIKSLEEKLRNFRRGFIQFYGCTPEFFADLLYVKKLKIKPTQF